MKRSLIHALCLAVAALGGTRLAAQADPTPGTCGETSYVNCMDYCMMDGWGFNYCHEECVLCENPPV